MKMKSCIKMLSLLQVLFLIFVLLSGCAREVDSSSGKIMKLMFLKKQIYLYKSLKYLKPAQEMIKTL